MDSIFGLAQRSAGLLLRLSLGLVLLWIAALKFADPAPVRGLLAAPLPFLASNAFVLCGGCAGDHCGDPLVRRPLGALRGAGCAGSLRRNADHLSGCACLGRRKQPQTLSCQRSREGEAGRVMYRALTADSTARDPAMAHVLRLIRICAFFDSNTSATLKFRSE